MFVINLFGGPGTGKSTIAAGLFYNLKIKGFNVELITEYAKDCVYQHRTEILKHDQIYVFAKQNHKLNSLIYYEPKLDFVIVDSPLILSNIFGNIFHSIPKSFEQTVLDIFNSYENLNFKLLPNFAYQKSGRLETQEQAREVDKQISEYLKNKHIFYEQIKNIGTDTINNILNSQQLKHLIEEK